MRVARNGEIGKIREGLRPALGFECSCAHIAAKHLCDLDVEQMRSVQGFAVTEKPHGQTPAR